MAKVAFRMDASESAGLGHLRRCVALATELRDIGVESRLVCRERFDASIGALAMPHPVFWLEMAKRDGSGGADEGDEHCDADATLAIIGRNPAEPSCVVVDSYRLGHRWERRVREAGHRIVAIDDFRDRMHHADLLVSDAAFPFDARLNTLDDGGRVLCGNAYALIGREYAHPTASVRDSGPKRVLVTYGGSDPTQETIKAVAAIAAAKEGKVAAKGFGRADIVIGMLNPAAAEIARAAARVDGLTVHAAPHGLAELMKASDVVLTAGGSSMLEALAMRKPCVVTTTAENQRLTVGELAASGVIRSLGHASDVDATGIAEALADILARYDQVAANVAARSPFDHLGGRRVAREMSSLLGSAPHLHEAAAVSRERGA